MEQKEKRMLVLPNMQIVQSSGRATGKGASNVDESQELVVSGPPSLVESVGGNWTRQASLVALIKKEQTHGEYYETPGPDRRTDP